MVSESKAALRKEMLTKRNAVSEAEIKERSKLIEARLFAIPEFKKAKTVSFYLSHDSEVNTLEMIRRAVTERKEVLVPTISGDDLELVKFTSFEDLAPVKFGILEPKTKTKPEHLPEVIITPGLAFDLDLHRLGYGKGYYDRFFKKLSSFNIGICFDFQIVEKIPRHEHDHRLDLTVSDKREISL
ncbi:MAG: 5-formyltetrahydrofolate cyclo-ligase [Candidatus Micrarchaeia archaeon]